MNDLEKARQTLLSGNFTCVLCHQGALYTATARGVKPLVVWYESGKDFSGYYEKHEYRNCETAELYANIGGIK